jgi:organic hydroperoxide reductase OsmC/OhrA
MIRKARAVWYGTGRSGKDDLSSDSGVLANTPYSFRTRFENEKGTNPEELIATFVGLAQDAEQNCPVSTVLRPEVTLDAKLV